MRSFLQVSGVGLYLTALVQAVGATKVNTTAAVPLKR